MAEVASPMTPYLSLDQPDPMKQVGQVQNFLINQQTQETNRRILDGQRAAGAAIQAARGVDGSIDPVKLSAVLQTLPADIQPAATQAAQTMESSEIANRNASAVAAQGQVSYVGQATGAFLAAHPGGITSAEASGLISDLSAEKAISEPTSLVMQTKLAAASSDADRRRILAEFHIRSLGPAGATPVDITGPGGIPTKTSLAGLVAGQEIPTGAPGAAGATPAAAGATPAAPVAPSLEGGPAVPAVPAGPAPVSGITPVATGLPAGSVSLVKSDADRVSTDIARGAQSAQNIGDIRNMLRDALAVTTGPNTAEILRLHTGWNQLFPGLPFDVTGAAKAEAFIKTSHALIARQGAGGGETDMSRGEQLASNLNANISNLGINMIGHQLLGNEAMFKAKERFARAYANDPAKLSENNGQWDDHGDPRVFQYQIMSPWERQEFLGAKYIPTSERKTKDAPHWAPPDDPLTGKTKIDPATGRPVVLDEQAYTDLDEFERNHQFAADHHWLDGIPSNFRGNLVQPFVFGAK